MRADEILLLPGMKELKKYDPINAKKPSGHIFVDGSQVADTVKCVHCGHHFIPIKGSGTIRGWCNHCGGALCGSKECFECKDFRKKLDEYEAGKLKTLR